MQVVVSLLKVVKNSIYSATNKQHEIRIIPLIDA